MNRTTKTLLFGVFALAVLSVCLISTVGSAEDTDATEGTVYYDSNNNEYVVNDGVLTVSKGTNGTGVLGNLPTISETYTSVVLNDTITSVGQQFRGRTDITSITLSNNLVSIGNMAFYGCTNAVFSGTLPSTLTSIGNGAFTSCANAGFTGSLPSGITVLDGSFYGCTALALSGTLPSGLTTIGAGTFSGCTALALSGTLPTTLTSIGANAFNNCTNVAFSGTLPSGLELGYGAFYRCMSITFTGSLPSGLTSIGSATFDTCTNLALSGTLPSGLTTIGASAFKSCTNLALSGTLPSGLTSIGQSAFKSCTNLALSGTLPTTLTSIGANAFKSCTNLALSGTLPSGLTVLNDYVFYKTQVAFSGTLPSGLTSIGQSAFEECSNVAFKGELPSGLTSIGTYAFLSAVRCDFSGTLPSTLTSIGNYALCDVPSDYDVSATTPATIGTISPFWSHSTFYVPSELLSTYQTAWSSYSSQITTHTNATVGDYIKIIVGEPYYFGYTITSYDNTKLSQSNGYITGLSQCVTEITYTVNSASVTKKVCICKDYISDDYAEQLSELYDKYHGKKIAVMGDSISANPSEPTEWYNLFAYDVGASIVAVSGIAGTTVQNDNQYGVAMAQYSRINLLDDNGQPDFVFIFGGTNDSMDAPGTFNSSATYCNQLDTTATTYTSFIEAYSIMLWRIHNLMPNATIVCIEPYRPTADLMNTQISALCDYLNDTTFSGLTTQFDIECYSLKGLFDLSIYTNDTLHPNHVGELEFVRLLEGLMEEGVVSSTVSWPDTSSASTGLSTDYTLSGITGAGQIGYYSSDANATVTSNTGNTAVTFTPTKTGTSTYTLFETNRGTTKTLALTVNQSYTVTFNVNGGSEVASQTVASGSVATQPTNPTKTGNTFAGWYSDSALTTEYVWTTPITQNTTIYAKWTVNTYTVSFALNEGTGTVPSQTINYGGTVTVPNPAPTRTGYTFDGWYKGLEAYDFSGLVMSNFTLTAHWTINTYTVSFVTNNGTTINSQSVEYNGTATVPDVDLSKTGYTFGGWYKGTAQYVFSTPVTENLTLTAQWNVMDYTIVFNTNGGSAIANVSYNVESATFSLSIPTKTGYTFAGWYDNANLTGSAVTQISIGSTGDRTFYAKWTPTDYTVTFNTNGGSVIEPIHFTVESSEFSLSTPTKTGYTFNGWYLNENLTGTAITKIAHGTVGDQNVYAKWTPTTYTITYNVNGGTAIESQTYNITSQEITLPTPVKSGYTFNGWYMSSDLSGTAVTKVVSGSANNYTFYAKWTQNASQDSTKTTTTENKDTNILEDPVCIVGIAVAIIGILAFLFVIGDPRVLLVVVAGVVVAIIGYIL